MTSRKPSWVEILEKEIERLNGRIDKMRDFLTSIIPLMMDETEMISRLRTLGVLSDNWSTDIVFKQIETLLSEERVLVNEFKSPKAIKEMALDYLKRRIPLYILLARAKGIAFDDLASLLVKKLGLNLARGIVPLDSLIQHFGVKNAESWKKIVKK